MAADPYFPAEPVAIAIREHQTDATIVWEHTRLSQILYTTEGPFKRDFDLRIPQAVIYYKPLSRRTLATYTLGRYPDLGTRTSVTFNTRYLDRPIADIVATWFHELLHGWEEWELERERGGWYHSKPWRDKMEELGIVADSRGHHLEVLPRFYRYLRKFNIDPALPTPAATPVRPPADARGRAPRQRQMPKWVCGCSKPAGEERRRSQAGNPVRAIYLNARCLDCGEVYRRVTGS